MNGAEAVHHKPHHPPPPRRRQRQPDAADPRAAAAQTIEPAPSPPDFGALLQGALPRGTRDRAGHGPDASSGGNMPERSGDVAADGTIAARDAIGRLAGGRGDRPARVLGAGERAKESAEPTAPNDANTGAEGGGGAAESAPGVRPSGSNDVSAGSAQGNASNDATTFDPTGSTSPATNASTASSSLGALPTSLLRDVPPTSIQGAPRPEHGALTLAVTGGAPTAPPPGLAPSGAGPSVATSSVPTQIIQVLSDQISRGGQLNATVVLRLEPPDLGAVILRVSTRDGRNVRLRFEVERSDAGEALTRGKEQIAHYLAANGLAAEDVSVDSVPSYGLSSDGSSAGAGAGPGSQPGGSDQGESSGRPVPGSVAAVDRSRETRAAETILSSAGRLVDYRL